MVKTIKKESEVMKLKLSTLFLGAAAMLSSCGAPQDVKSEKSEMRAPAYPLVMIDPYTSAWSFTDNLYDGPVKHWTGLPVLGCCQGRRTDLPFHGNGRT